MKRWRLVAVVIVSSSIRNCPAYLFGVYTSPPYGYIYASTCLLKVFVFSRLVFTLQSHTLPMRMYGFRPVYTRVRT
jgi:hypothetical protein